MLAAILAATLSASRPSDVREHELRSSVTVTGSCVSKCQDQRVFGTGEIIEHQADGALVVLTARHVVEDMREPRVFLRGDVEPGARATTGLRDGRGLPATIVAESRDADLALLRIRPLGATPYTIASFSSDQRPHDGDIIGDPYGALWTVSPYEAVVDDGTDAVLVSCPSCGPGDSGGGVFDDRGRLAGILVSQQVLVTGNEPVAFGKRSSRFKIVPLDDVRAFLASVPPQAETNAASRPRDPWDRFDSAGGPQGMDRSGDPWSRFAPRNASAP